MTPLAAWGQQGAAEMSVTLQAAAETRAHRCTSCGATVQVDPHVASTSCRYCDAPLVDVTLAAEHLDALVSFQLTDVQAGHKLRERLQEAWFVPRRVRQAAAPTSLRPAFVPFYVFDAVARSSWSARIGIYWYRTETYTTTDSDGRTVSRTRTVRETDWHPLSGTHGRRWHDHLVSASKGLPEDESNDLEPFALEQARPFAAELVAGITAELPTVSHDDAHAMAEHELSELERKVIAGELLPGDTHSGLHSSTEVTVERLRLVLLPVFMAVYHHDGEAFRLLVNGQTGRVAGRIPRDKVAIALAVAAAVGLVALAGLLVWFLLSHTGAW